MRKFVKIDGKQIPLQSDGGTMRKYRRFFNRDFLTDVTSFSVFLRTGKGSGLDIGTIMENLAWVLAKRADDTIPDIDEWLEGFDDPMAILNASEDVFSLIQESNKSTIEPKKKETAQEADS